MSHKYLTNQCYSVLKPNFGYRYQVPQLYTRKQEIFALTFRLIIQAIRRPSLFITGIIQPLLWLLLFSALFQNAPIELFTYTTRYSDFLSSGIIVFTGFTSSLNAGLPIMFDREFGFFNRILSAPIFSRSSIIVASSLNIILSSCIQVLCIICTVKILGNSIPDIYSAAIVLLTLLALINSVTIVSLILAFILPGHIELLACLLIINLPLLFSSTALAPLAFMPSWLQVIASLNPLTYAIEMIRFAYLNSSYSIKSVVISNVWGTISIEKIIFILILTNFISIFMGRQLIANKFED
uniref:ABC transmembrane type-2 domain-containing protein n=1 Tax=Helminthocladia australis TaxID=260093 RepID=A0A1G4NU55_9FLOR|nr:Hypothetical protein ycf38 [Helminthocladia australis]SCW22029.1 Hypothetical protein ycf38 [Helminthocladia australis]